MDQSLRSSLKRFVSAGPNVATKLLQASITLVSFSEDEDLLKTKIDQTSSKFVVSECLHVHDRQILPQWSQTLKILLSRRWESRDKPLQEQQKHTGKIHLPLVALQCGKPNTKKVVSHQEDVHSLRLFHNHYLQWRFANTKFEARMKAQKREVEVRHLGNKNAWWLNWMNL